MSTATAQPTALAPDAERIRWINLHGSDILQESAQNNYPCQAEYIRERLEMERPGWEIAGDLPGRFASMRSPSFNELQLLDEAREVSLTCELRLWRQPKPDHGKAPKPFHVAFDSFHGVDVVLTPEPAHASDWKLLCSTWIVRGIVAVCRFTGKWSAIIAAKVLNAVAVNSRRLADYLKPSV